MSAEHRQLPGETGCGPFAVDPRRTGPGATARPGRAVGLAVWVAGIAVAGGAALATAHGLYEVALAARVPAGIAWIYPLITDGLALLAYIATARLRRSGARYAWTVVVLAAGLSGLAQASYLTADPGPGGVLAVSAALRFGVGAWPAVAAAIVAHLLYLLARFDEAVTPRDCPDHDSSGADPTGRRSVPQRPAVAIHAAAFSRTEGPPSVHAPALNAVPVHGSSDAALGPTGSRSSDQHDSPATPAARVAEAPARDRAVGAAARLAARSGALPTVTEVENEARVSRGTAAAALKALRADPDRIAVLIEDSQNRTQP